MLKGLSPLRLRVIIVLSFVAIALLTGLLFVRPWETIPAGGTPAPDDPPEHKKIRTAEISLNPALSWELSLAGNNKEEAVASFVRGGYLYIFGNTASFDLDFDRPGVFLAVIDVYGLTKGFFVYGGENEVLRAVTLCEGGFLLAVEVPTSPKLYVVDFSGNQTRVISGFLPSFESVWEVKYYSGGYLLFTGPANNLTGIKGLRCCFFTTALEFSSSRLAVSPYSLEHFESVVISNRAVALVNAVSTLHTLPAAVEFSQSDSPKIHIFTGFAGAIAGLSIFEGEFLLLTAMEGASLLQITLDYTVKNRVFLSQLSALSFTEVGPYNPMQLYLAFVDSAVYLINGKGERKATLPAFIPAKHAGGRAYAGDLVVYAGEGGVRAYSNQKVELAANIGGGGRDSFIVMDENNLFYIYHVSGDVRIVKLRTMY
ncbi:MAG: hypothetical protein FWE84_00635 [Firmicutes bacterium]|nr:hypothetical protein [Bacillota bacterium]